MFVKPDFALSTYLGDDLTTQHCQDHIQNRCYPVQEWYIIYHLYVSLILPTSSKTLYSSLISSHECLCRPSPSSGSGSWQKRLEPEQTRWWLQLYTYINISRCENNLRLLAKRVERVLEERPNLLQLFLPNISRVLGCLSLKEKKSACRECLPA